MKRVVYFEYLAAPVFAERLAAEPDIALTRLEYAAPAEMNWRVMAEAHAYQVTSSRQELPADYWVNDALFARCPNLLVVSTNGVGYDSLDIDACTRAGVLAVNQVGGNKEAVAEHVLAMMLSLAKRIPEADRAVRRGTVKNRNALIGNDVVGRTIGIVGVGHIGTRVAELCRLAFGMRVLAYDPYLDAEECAARGAEKVELDALLAEADFVSINCPRTAETRGMIGAAAFARMKPTAFFVTTARGGIHDEAALAAALAEGRIAGAGLDVWEDEPPPVDHPLLGFDNVIVSPHTAGVTRESRHNIAAIAADQLVRTLAGERPPRLLNPEAWPAWSERWRRITGRAA